MLHLHRLKDRQPVAFLHRLTDLCKDGFDEPGHRGFDDVGVPCSTRISIQRVNDFEDLPIVVEDRDLCASDRDTRHRRTVDQPSPRTTLSPQSVFAYLPDLVVWTFDLNIKINDIARLQLKNRLSVQPPG